MIDSNSSPDKITKQARIADGHKYNISGLDDFLNAVFHVELQQNENILTWMTSSNIPAYPISDEELLTKLARVPVAKALYYATSTTKKDPNDGKLYNRKALFKRFYVLVLDDIGTKVPVSKIPENFKPTYIIESSKGNFQYGYVLDEPIEVIEQAETLVQLVYEAGLSDNGGKMATKLVRLPDGVNGKQGEKGKFAVRLVELNDNYWSPADILDVLDLGVTWEQVVEDAEAVAKKRARHAQGAQAFIGRKSPSLTFDGVSDPVLDALYDDNRVIQETNDWATIVCPWGHEHTGDTSAGYSPLGRGEGNFVNTRGFKCFHEHCAHRTTEDFLQHINVTYGVEASTYVHPDVHALISQYVYDAAMNGIWNIKRSFPLFTPKQSLTAMIPDTIRIIREDGSVVSRKAVQMFLDNKEKVITHGEIYDPSTESVIVENNGSNYVNTFKHPTWGDGAYDTAEVEYFINYIKYLIPTESEREYFLDWVAAKAQNFLFRGAGILMVAKSQGTGRSTLAEMLTTVFGRHNCEKVPFEKLSGSGEFNEWQTKSLIITDETYAVGNLDSFYKVYERVKERIDLLPEEVRVNPKYGKQRSQMTHASYLMFSNHEDAMSVGHDDRRIYVITNPVVRATPEFFAELHKWKGRLDSDGNPVFARHIWRYFRQRKPDMRMLTAPAQMTDGKARMIQSAKSDIEKVITGILDVWPSPILSIMDIKQVIAPIAIRLDTDPKKLNKIIEKVVTQKTVSLGHKTFKHKGKVKRFRYINSKATDDDRAIMSSEDVSIIDLHPHLDKNDEMQADIKQAIEDVLTSNDL